MPAARFADSFRYGGRLVGYLFAVALVGGGAIGGGAVLAAPGRVGLDAVAVGTGRLAGGIALGVFGAVVLLVGLVGLAHKLVADAVSVGVEHGVPAPGPRDVAVSGDTTAENPQATDPSGAESERSIDDAGPAEPAPEATADGPSTAAGDADSVETTADPATDLSEEPPTPSAEEIVFGPTDDSGGAESGESAPEPTGEPDPGVDVTTEAGLGDGPSEDPLAEPSEDK